MRRRAPALLALSMVFLSMSILLAGAAAEVELSVLTDWQSYTAESKVMISGAMTGVDSAGGTTVSVKVTDPSGNVIFSDAPETIEKTTVSGGVEYIQIVYETSFTLSSTALTGEYTVEASALDVDASTSFKVIERTGHTLIIAMGAVIAVVVGAVVVQKRRSKINIDIEEAVD